jgi:hypothetical protein
VVRLSPGLAQGRLWVLLPQVRLRVEQAAQVLHVRYARVDRLGVALKALLDPDTECISTVSTQRSMRCCLDIPKESWQTLTRDTNLAAKSTSMSATASGRTTLFGWHPIPVFESKQGEKSGGASGARAHRSCPSYVCAHTGGMMNKLQGWAPTL